MPAHFGLGQQSMRGELDVVEDIEAPVLDTMIRHAGWHFMYLQGSYSRSRIGLTRDIATHEGHERSRARRTGTGSKRVSLIRTHDCRRR